MCSIISIGITKCLDEKTNEIKCASTDAKNIYDTFKKVLGNEFSDSSSICLTNIRSNEFLSLLSGVEKSLSEEDTVILYLSCHARIERNDELMLAFYDYDGTIDSLVSLIQLKDVLLRKNNNCIIIFDCCHSEIALKIANRENISSINNISVVASTVYYETAKYDEEGSEFTKNLCKAIMQVYNSGQDITINNIASETRDLGTKCFINLAEGEIDIVLKNSTFLNEEYADFSEVFLSKLLNSNRFVREMMWYSLKEIPTQISLEIINSFICNSSNLCEADWVVRRAVGSVISVMNENSTVFSEAIHKMLISDNWMLQTIGLIACRNNINSYIQQLIKDIIVCNSNTMSLVWLADLYLSDSEYADINISLSSNLAKTSWGIIQIWDRYITKFNPNELFEIITNHVLDESILKDLKTEICLRNNEFSLFDDAFECNLTEYKGNKLVSLLYKAHTRGRTIDKSKKWLLSIMYGNWRGKISVNLDEYFSNTRESTIIKELELIQSIPSPEKRASLFSYFQHSPEVFEKYKGYVYWGIIDSHPWVRKEAVLAFKNDALIINNAFDSIIDRYLYIGVFDLIISSSNYMDKPVLRKYIDKYQLTQCEKNSLLSSIKNE